MIDSKTKQQIPLYHVNNKIKISNNIAEIVYEQFYFNPSEEPIETQYSYPTHVDAVFAGIELKFQDKVIVSRIEERQKAQEKYEDAVASGKTAMVSHSTPGSKDIVSVFLGGIPPKSEIVLVCTFYQILEVDDLSWSLMIPSKIVPRYSGDALKYVATGSGLAGAPESEADKETVENRIKDLEEACSAYYQKTNFTWNLELTINSDSAITRLVSFSHDIDTKFTDENLKEAVVTLKDSDKSLFDKNFQLLFRNDKVNSPSVLAQVKGDEIGLAVSFLADLTPQEEIEKRKALNQDGPDLDSAIRYYQENETMFAQEYYFVLDRSGSMWGKPIAVAKEAMKLFIRSLPPGSKFNIISFGSEHEKVFPSALEYTQDTLNLAIKDIETFDANLGGTEIYQPLKSIFDDLSGDQNLNKHVYLLTDGCVFNPQEVINLIQDNNKMFTTHTFGIGDGVSTELIEECASAGLGKYYYVDNDANGLKGKIIDALEKSFDPFFSITNQKLDIPNEKILEYPRFDQISRFYHGDYSTYLTILKASELAKLDGTLSIGLANSQTEENSSIEIDIAENCKQIEGDSIFKLITKTALDDLIKNRNTEEAKALSIKYQVPCKLTSFFAAERLIDPTTNAYKFEQVKSKDLSTNITLSVKTLTGKTLVFDNISVF